MIVNIQRLYRKTGIMFTDEELEMILIPQFLCSLKVCGMKSSTADTRLGFVNSFWPRNGSGYTLL